MEATKQKWAEEAERSLVVLESLVRDEEGWSLESKKGSEITVWKRFVPNSSWAQFKVMTTVNLPPVDVFKVVYDIEGRLKWDGVCTEYKVIDAIKDDKFHTEITYCATSSMMGGMIAARDYVDIRAYKSLPDGSIVSGGPSTEHPDYPPRSGYVRGFNFPSGFWFGAVPDQPNKTRFIYLVQSDLKGMMPAWMVNKGMSGALTTIVQNLLKHLRKTHPNA